MLDFLGSALVSFIEKEIVKHEPEIQKFVVDQLCKLSTILVEYISQKCQEDLMQEGLIEHKKEEEKNEPYGGTD